MLYFNDFFPSEVFAFVSDNSLDFTLKDFNNPFDSKQKDFLVSQLGEIKRISNVRQIHGAQVVLATEQEEIPEADGQLTNKEQQAIVVRTADCLPVFIYDTKNKAIALVHAGWRGSREHIVRNTLKKMQEEFGSSPEDITIAFGPCIRTCCYKVGRKFKEYFPTSVIEKGPGVYLDLAEVNKKELLELGVKKENIRDSRICTCCNKKLFSYRRDGEETGRMISIMMLK